MTFRRASIVLLASLFVTSAACKSGSGSKPDESLTDGESRVPGYFHEIPADSFYVYAGLEPVPKEIVASRLESGEKSLFVSYLEMVRDDSSGSSFSEIASAILDEIEGTLDPEGYKELGLSMRPRAAIYAVGGMPVFRMKLGDTEAFKGLLSRVETEAEVDVRVKESEGTKYRLYKDDEIHVPVVVRGGAVVVAAYHQDAGDVLLPYVLGHREPEKSLADTGAIQNLVDSYGYKPYGAGYVDLRGLIRTMTGVRKPGAATKAVFEATDHSIETASETCKEEIRAVTDRAPRLVFGTTAFKPDRVEGEIGVELDEELGEKFAGLTNPIPGVETDVFSDAMLAMGFGVDVEKWTTMIGAHAKSISDEPYECKDLGDLNRWAREYKNRPIPPSIAQLQGAAVIVKDAAFRAQQVRPSKLQAMVLVRLNNPQTLIGRLQTLVPGMMQADIKDNGVPVPLEKLGNQLPFLEAPHVALKGETLGFSAGVGMQDSMAALLENPASDATQTAAALGYDLDKMRAAIPKRYKKSIANQLGQGVLASTLDGGGQLRLVFRKSGIFLRTSSRREQNEPAGAEEGTQASPESRDGVRPGTIRTSGGSKR